MFGMHKGLYILDQAGMAAKVVSRSASWRIRILLGAQKWPLISLKLGAFLLLFMGL
jgi:hypothetical protein